MFINNNYKVKLKNIKKPINVRWTSEQKKLKNDIINHYDVNKGYIIISSDNKILDGRHRYLILLNHYGEEHEIIVKKIGVRRLFANITLIFLSPVLLMIALLLKLYRLVRNYR